MTIQQVQQKELLVQQTLNLHKLANHAQ